MATAGTSTSGTRATRSGQKLMEMPTFGHLKKFPRGKLPTLKEVIGRCLFVGNFKSDATLVLVAKELEELWIECNVYPISTQAIKKKIKQDIQEYSRLCKYDKKKRGARMIKKYS